MEGKNENSQVMDLTNIKCPMNLVKFKYYLHENIIKLFLISKEGSAFNNICEFLDFKKLPFETWEAGKNYMIKLKS